MSQAEELADSAQQLQPSLTDAGASGTTSSEQAMPASELLRAAAKHGHRIPSELEQQQKLLRQLTHLHLNGLKLKQLHSLRLCPRLQVLYLYDNQLTSIASVCSNNLLTHMYIQNNRLQQLDGLQDLGLLQKLYLQGNRLAVIDQLSACTRLEELHVSDQQWQQTPEDVEQQQQQQQQLEQQQQQLEQHCEQRYTQQQQPCQQHEVLSATAQSASQDAAGSSESSNAAGADPEQHCADTGPQTQPAPGASTGLMLPGLCFEPASLQAISGSLRVLCAANCGIRDPGPLAVLLKLRTLDLSGNSIGRLQLLQPLLQGLQRLRVLDVDGNPCLQHELKHRDYIILVAADSLEVLNNEAVPAAHRAFLLALHLNKLRAQDDSQEQQQQQQQKQGVEQQLGRQLRGQLQHQQAAQQWCGRCPASKAITVGQGAGSGACAGLAGTGVHVKLHAVQPPALRPSAAGGYNVGASRIAAVLGGTHGRAVGRGIPFDEHL